MELIRDYEKHLRKNHKPIDTNLIRGNCPYKICEKSMSTPSNTIRHIKQNHLGMKKKEKPVSCNRCDKLFASKSSFYRHRREKHQNLKRDQEKFKCEIDECGRMEKFYSGRDSYNQHVARVHEKKYICYCPYENCKTEFTTTNSLNIHIATIHKQETQAECDHCKEILTDQYKLERHIQTVHLKATMVECETCNLILSDNDKLQRHIERGACYQEKFTWNRWERLCKEIAEILFEEKEWYWQKQYFYKTTNGYTRYIVPEIQLQKDEKLVFIDAKVSKGSIHAKDLKIYPRYADELEFWILFGKDEKYIVEVNGIEKQVRNITCDTLISQLEEIENGKVVKVILAIRLLREGKDPKRTTSLQDFFV